MADFLLELLSEEIPARMQAKAAADLERLFTAEIAKAGLSASAVETFVTPRRLALIARGLPDATAAVREELKGPRTAAPPQALEGFLRKTGLTQAQLEERNGVYFAVIERPGRPAAQVLAEAVPAIVRDFPWPKSMRWGAASLSTDSPRWVRPLQGIVALLGEAIVDMEVAGIRSGAATVGHRFHHPGIITIGGAHDYQEKLRACHVIVDPAERRRIIAEGAARAAADAGLALVEDAGLLAENAGLTEWPVPLLGRFDHAFLDVPAEVIQLTMRTNQKYFALSPPLPSGEGYAPQGAGEGRSGPLPDATRPALSPEGRGGKLAPAFICTANIDAHDGGTAIVAGNEKVLAARLSDARFFWEGDRKVPLAEQAKKLSGILFHEKLGTLADKAARIELLARWLVSRRLLLPKPPAASSVVESGVPRGKEDVWVEPAKPANGDRSVVVQDAAMAARLAKADLVTGMVGEFPELQGVIGGYLARAEGMPERVVGAIRDQYKPVGQGDTVPSEEVAVAVALADKLDSLLAFFSVGEKPTGSRDPFALRRAALGVLQIITANGLRLPLRDLLGQAALLARLSQVGALGTVTLPDLWSDEDPDHDITASVGQLTYRGGEHVIARWDTDATPTLEKGRLVEDVLDLTAELFAFFADRLKVQQREAGVRHDLIDAVYALGNEDDLVRMLARVRALQELVESPAGADLLTGYRRAANILKKEGFEGGRRNSFFSYNPLAEERALDSALDTAEPRLADALAAEDFGGAMALLAALRGPIDAFFDKVTVNDADPEKRETRLILLTRIRNAMHQVADFGRIEG